MSPDNYVYLAAILFTIGTIGVMTRRNALVAFALARGNLDGQIATFFVMVVAAAEVVVGLSIIITIYRTRRSTSVDAASLLKL